MGRAKYRKERALFKAQALDMLHQLGAEDKDEGVPWACLVIETKAGPLKLSIHDGAYRIDLPYYNGKGDFLWIARRFESVKRAVQMLGGDVNPYSGKWNHLYWRDFKESFEYGLNRLKHRIQEILP